MSRFHSYINTALKLIETYKGDVPFATFIKQFFSGERKYGSSDRRQISSLCYSYFRLGHAFQRKATEANLLTAVFLCNHAPSPLLRALQPELDDLAEMPLEKKLALVKDRLNISAIFPFQAELNSGISFEQFSKSLLVQPNLFVRVRPKHKPTALKKVAKSGISFQLRNNDNCIEFAASTNIENLLEADREIVVQDYNSQQVLNYLKELPLPETGLNVWDCCAASGGKSILVTDLLQRRFKLTVSDIRTSSILKLHQRFLKAGIKEYDYFIADIGAGAANPASKMYDLVICDAPCTGSGTWSRTPEQLYHFDPASIDVYTHMQRAIVTSAIQSLKPGGYFIYITCSVFKKENEAITEFIYQQGLLLMHAQALYGYHMRADSMYVSVFQR